MKLFNVCEVKEVGLDETNVMCPSCGWVMVLERDGVYYGWSDHRGLKLPIGKWIKFRGNDRMVDVAVAPIGDAKSYRNGFHAVFSRWPYGIKGRELGFDGYDLGCAQRRVRNWSALKHRKNMELQELKVDLRGVTPVGEMLLGDHGPNYRGCVCREIFIPKSRG